MSVPVLQQNFMGKTGSGLDLVQGILLANHCYKQQWEQYLDEYAAGIIVSKTYLEHENLIKGLPLYLSD